MTWMRVTLTANDVLAGRLRDLQDAFAAAHLAAGFPKRAAFFAGGRPHDSNNYYFTPEAVAIFGATLAAYGAETCSAPQKAGASLMFGETDAWDMLSSSASKDG